MKTFNVTLSESEVLLVELALCNLCKELKSSFKDLEKTRALCIDLYGRFVDYSNEIED